MRIALVAAILSMAAALAGCVGPTPYQPAARGFGYTEERLDQNKFRVSFRGNSQTARETVEDYLLYRAAELTLENGYTHFLVTGRDTEAKTSYRIWIDHFGGRGWFNHGFPGWWRHDPLFRPWPHDVQPVTTYTASAEIVMLKAPYSDQEVRSFAAQEVLTQVGPRVVRPEAPK